MNVWISNRMVADAGEAPVGLVDASGTFSCGPVVARLSRWRLVATLQVAEAVVVAISSGIWLRDIVTVGGGHAGFSGMLRFGLAVAVVVHFVLRSLGAYRFGRILRPWRSSMTAAVAWMLSSAPLLSWSIMLQPHDALWLSLFPELDHWRSVDHPGSPRNQLCWRCAVAGATARPQRSDLGDGSDAQDRSQLLRTDGSGTNVIGFVSVRNDDPNGFEKQPPRRFHFDTAPTYPNLPRATM